MKEIEQEKTKMSKRMIPSLLCAGIIASMTATPLYAETVTADETKDDSTVVGESGVKTSKSIVLNDDGTYTIDLEAYSTGSTAISQVTRNMPLDVVLVMDQSGSLGPSIESVKTAAREFVQTMVDDEANAEEKVEHRVAVVGFAGLDSESNTEMYVKDRYKQYLNLTDSDYQNAFLPVSDSQGNVNSNVSAAINGLAAKGGTRPGFGMKMANSIFANNPETETRRAQRVIVLFTDGVPQYYSDEGFNDEWAKEAIDESYTAKNSHNALVYTVGFFKSNEYRQELTNMMNLISSNYPQGQAPTGWNKVSNLDKSKTYYVRNSANEMVAVTYSGGPTIWTDTSGNKYIEFITQFYEHGIDLSADIGTGSSDKYYLNSSSVSDLSDMFKAISSDVIKPSTEIELGAESVIRDILEKGFKRTVATTVTYEVYKGTSNAEGNIEFDKTVNVSKTEEFIQQNSAETVQGSAEITSSFNGQNVDVKGFNFSKNYVAYNHDGYMIKITITGILPDETNVQFNKVVYTNGENSGIYSNEENADNAKDGIKFERPTTYLADKAYVVDYAKRISMNADDWKLQTVKNVSGNYQKLTSLTEGLDNLSTIATKSGKFSANGNLGATYTPTTTKWENIDKFFAFGKTQDSEVVDLDAHKTTKNLWSRVSVVPANSVYYEDTFVTDSGRVGIEYTGAWAANGEGSDDYTTSGAHGYWNDASTADSDKTYHVADANDEAVSSASYTFKGTGTDIYSRTNMKSGTIIVQVKGTILNEETKKPAYRKTFIIDTKSMSSGDGNYYTIPTFSVMDLPYDTYTVKLTVTSAAAEIDAARRKFYLDGIRIYNPLDDGKAASGISGVYDGEYHAHFYPVKELVQKGAAVFIDEILNEDGTVTPTVEAYDHENSPANEIYLDKQQQVVIQIPEGTHDKVYIGLKAHDGKSVKVQLNKQTVTVSSTMDQYWEVTPDENKCIVIKNTDETEDGLSNLLAITNIRTAHSNYAENVETPVIQTLSNDKALASYLMFTELDNEGDPDNGEDLPGDDVEIDNDDDNVDSDVESKSWWEILFGGLFGWFH